MKTLLDYKPFGYVEASFARYGEESIELNMVLPSNTTGEYRIVLYNYETNSVQACAVSEKTVIINDMIEKLECGTEWLLCVQNEERIEYLRNFECKVTKLQNKEMYDKRALYGKPIRMSNGKVLLLSYQTNGILKLEVCESESHVYMSQIMNEIVHTNEIGDGDNRKYHMGIKCKAVKGNYIGIIPYEQINLEDLGSRCIQYNSCEEGKEEVYMNFELPEVFVKDDVKLCVAWTFRGQVYTAPLSYAAKVKLADVTQLKYNEKDGLKVDVAYNSSLYGDFIKAEFVKSVEQWDKENCIKILPTDIKNDTDNTVISFTVNNFDDFSLLDTWYINIYTGKDGVEHTLELTIPDKLKKEDIFFDKDTKYKLSIKKDADRFIIKKQFGHNALFSKNIQATGDMGLDEFLSLDNIGLKGNMYAEYVEEAGRTKVRLYQYMENVIEAKVVMFHTQGMGAVASHDLEVKDGAIEEFEINIPDVNHCFSKPIDSVWFRVAIAIRTMDGIYLSMLSNYDFDTDVEQEGNIHDSRKLYLTPVGNASICGVDMTAVPYYAANKALAIKFVRPQKLYRSQFTNEILDVKIKKDILIVKMRCRKIDGIYKGVVMEYRNVKEEDAETYYIPYDSLVDKGEFFLMTTRIDMKKYYMRMLYWDIRCAFEIEDRLFTVSCHSNNQKLLRKYKKVFVDRTYPNENSIMFPFATGSNSVALMHREVCPQDNWRFRLKEKFAEKLYKLNKNHWDKKNIYLIFEKYCTMAQDNGYFFFKYCMDAEVEKDFDGEIYYVIDKNAADWEKVVPYKKHVLKYLSIKHMIYLQACKLMISTDTKGHAYVWRSMGSNIKALTYQKKLVFLQHGVTAFKRGHFERGTNVGCESFITTSQFEHDIIRDYLGYTEEEIPITGFARWDVLHDKSEGHREILMMPTWRTWLDDAENDVFAESDYCKNYMALLNDPRLDDILKRYDVTLNFYLHPKFRKFITEFSVVSNNIRLIPFGEEPLNELMMQCNLLITDFSSVAWDVYYMNKPVLFYHFDLDDAYKTLGFYMDMRNDIFGERAEEPEELMQLIIEYIENGFVMKEKYSKDREKYFAYVDDNNSERIWKAIQERDWSI